MIYLIKNSPHNEDFILAGYAVCTLGIKKLVAEYYQDVYGEPFNRMIVVDYAANEVRVKAKETWETDQVLYLVPIPQVEKSW